MWLDLRSMESGFVPGTLWFRILLPTSQALEEEEEEEGEKGEGERGGEEGGEGEGEEKEVGGRRRSNHTQKHKKHNNIDSLTLTFIP